ncbi:hypothetical protein [Roseateles asaccharophilus]|uniref:Uncharacterized protein n=1 Tax=Roseateles asaccharophilus TaxID=582607 RepID=A0ABU2A2X7_9BURK|nr:hypothetical protein [Roseateles asaccharophilus]MDR7331524.1 hypothetical protein [Roseateles asaccharophilus]
MPYRFSSLIVLLMLLWRPASAAELTPLEYRWLQGVWPVVSHARQQLALPLDIVVQPQDAPGAAPLALGFVDGRCKLVLSLRGNPLGQRQLDAIAADLQAAALELMAAHEVGHCRRYLDGAWFSLPAGFVAAQVPAGLSTDLQQAWLYMRSTRREEAYGDLVGLAWVKERHPGLYGRLHAWLVAERSADLLPGSHHDTLAWLALVRDGRVLQGRDPFEAAAKVWREGLKD